jgi:hypothetical protein
MSGWIKLHRKMLKWEWYEDINVCRLWTHLLLKANHKDNKWKGIEVKAGQLITGRIALSAETGLTEQQTRTALSKLKSTGEITIKISNKFSIITITSWPIHQQDNQQSNQQVTSQQPTSNHKQECKELKNEKKQDSTPYQAVVDSYHERLPTLPGVRKLTDTRKRHIRARWAEIVKQGKDETYFDNYFDYVSGSEFLTRGTFDLEWLMKEANHLKVTEGKYHND